MSVQQCIIAEREAKAHVRKHQTKVSSAVGAGTEAVIGDRPVSMGTLRTAYRNRREDLELSCKQWLRANHSKITALYGGNMTSAAREVFKKGK